MKIESIQLNDTTIAEVIATGMVISNTEDSLDLIGNLYYQGFEKVIVYERNLTPEFFDLKSGLAGEILQKFSNYRMELAIVGDFDSYQSKSIQDFIRESNTLGHINFVRSKPEAIDRLIRKK